MAIELWTYYIYRCQDEARVSKVVRIWFTTISFAQLNSIADRFRNDYPSPIYAARFQGPWNEQWYIHGECKTYMRLWVSTDRSYLRSLGWNRLCLLSLLARNAGIAHEL